MSLAEMKMDAVTVSVGLLHDVVEDTLVSLEDVERIFGADVAHIVDGVTKISQIYFTSKEEKQAENFRKMLLAMTDDIRVIMVKFADRLHNMRTLQHLSSERREAIARETLDIYAPLAIGSAWQNPRRNSRTSRFSYLEPKSYQELKEVVERKRKSHEAFSCRGDAKSWKAKMKEHGIPCQIESRVKRLYSISPQASESSESPLMKSTIFWPFASSPTTSRTAMRRWALSTTRGGQSPAASRISFPAAS
jgi:GTP pyrophosphokinase